MARPFALIPDDQYQRLLSGGQGGSASGGRGSSGGRAGRSNDDTKDVAMEVDGSLGGGGHELRVYGLDRTDDDMLATLAELLPKNLRSKARVLLHHLNGKVALDADNRVVYESSDGGKQVGSHLLDLVRSLVSPTGTFDAQRPVDLPQFASAILGMVPQSALGAGKNLSEIASDRHPPGQKRPPPLARRKTVRLRKTAKRRKTTKERRR